MLSTPVTSQLRLKEFQDVYEPAEDTFALLDALEKDAKKLRQMAEMKNLLTAEIG